MAVSQETLTIIGVGIALAGIIFASSGQLGDRIDRLENRIDRMDVRLAAVEGETARIIGLLEGRDVTGLPLPSHGTPGKADGDGVEALLPRTSLPG